MKLRRLNEKDIKHSCYNLVSFEQINDHGYFNTYALECEWKKAPEFQLAMESVRKGLCRAWELDWDIHD